MADRLRGRAGVERRKRWLEAHPLCVRCEERGIVREGTTPDHIVALTNGGADDESNLQTLCDECHDVKTAEDLGHRKRSSGGPDGMPTSPGHHWNAAA